MTKLRYISKLTELACHTWTLSQRFKALPLSNSLLKVELQSFASQLEALSMDFLLAAEVTFSEDADIDTNQSLYQNAVSALGNVYNLFTPLYAFYFSLLDFKGRHGKIQRKLLVTDGREDQTFLDLDPLDTNSCQILKTSLEQIRGFVALRSLFDPKKARQLSDADIDSLMSYLSMPSYLVHLWSWGDHNQDLVVVFSHIEADAWHRLVSCDLPTWDALTLAGRQEPTLQSLLKKKDDLEFRTNRDEKTLRIMSFLHSTLGAAIYNNSGSIMTDSSSWTDQNSTEHKVRLSFTKILVRVFSKRAKRKDMILRDDRLVFARYNGAGLALSEQIPRISLLCIKMQRQHFHSTGYGILTVYWNKEDGKGIDGAEIYFDDPGTFFVCASCLALDIAVQRFALYIQRENSNLAIRSTQTIEQHTLLKILPFVQSGELDPTSEDSITHHLPNAEQTLATELQEPLATSG